MSDSPKERHKDMEQNSSTSDEDFNPTAGERDPETEDGGEDSSDVDFDVKNMDKEKAIGWSALLLGEDDWDDSDDSEGSYDPNANNADIEKIFQEPTSDMLDEPWEKRPIQKEIPVGEHYQANVPDIISLDDQMIENANSLYLELKGKIAYDGLLINANIMEELAELATEKYGNKPVDPDLIAKCLHICNYNEQRAKSGILNGEFIVKSQSRAYWDDTEKKLMQEALSLYPNKKFKTMQEMVKTKSLAEVMCYYYSWRKSEDALKWYHEIQNYYKSWCYENYNIDRHMKKLHNLHISKFTIGGIVIDEADPPWQGMQHKLEYDESQFRYFLFSRRKAGYRPPVPYPDLNVTYEYQNVPEVNKQENGAAKRQRE